MMSCVKQLSFKLRLKETVSEGLRRPVLGSEFQTADTKDVNYVYVCRWWCVLARAAVFAVEPMNVCWWKEQTSKLSHLTLTDLFRSTLIVSTSSFRTTTTLMPVLTRQVYTMTSMNNFFHVQCLVFEVCFLIPCSMLPTLCLKKKGPPVNSL